MPTFPFDPTGQVDTPCNAYCMAAAARAAYTPNIDLGDLLLGQWQLDRYRSFDDATIEGYIELLKDLCPRARP